MIFPVCCWLCSILREDSLSVQAESLSASSLIPPWGLPTNAKQCVDCATTAELTVGFLSLPVQRSPTAFLLLYTVEKPNHT